MKGMLLGLAVLGLILSACATGVRAGDPAATIDPARPPFPVPASRWVTETISGGTAWYPSMAVDSAGNLHVAYIDTLAHTLQYARRTGSSWQIERINTTYPVGDFACIALDRSDSPHFVYRTYQVEEFYYAYKPNGTWVHELISYGLPEPWTGIEPSLAMDSKGGPHVAFYDAYESAMKESFLVYASRDQGSGNWSTLYLRSTMRYTLYPDYFGTSMVIDSEDNPHIASYSAVPGWSAIMHDYLVGGSWVSEEVLNQTPIYNMKAKPSLQLDSKGVPHVSYFRDLFEPPLGGGPIEYARRGASGWSVDYIGLTGDKSSAVALDRSDRPHIAFLTNPFSLIYASKGRTWSMETVYSGDVDFTSRVLLAFDGEWNPHIVFKTHNLTTGQEILKHAYRIDHAMGKVGGIGGHWDADAQDSPPAHEPSCAVRPVEETSHARQRIPKMEPRARGAIPL